MVDNNNILNTNGPLKGSIQYNEQLETPIIDNKTPSQVVGNLLGNAIGETWEIGTGIAAAPFLAAENIFYNPEAYKTEAARVISENPDVYTPQQRIQMMDRPLYATRNEDNKLVPHYTEEVINNAIQSIKQTPQVVAGLSRSVANQPSFLSGKLSGSEYLNKVYTPEYMNTWGPGLQRFTEDVFPFLPVSPESQASLKSGRVNLPTGISRNVYNNPVSTGLAVAPAAKGFSTLAKTKLLNAANKAGASGLTKKISNIFNAGDIVENAQAWNLKNKAKQMFKAMDAIDNVVRKVSDSDLAKLFEAAETTEKRANLPAHLKPLFKKFKEGISQLQKLIPEKYLTDSEGMAAAQYVARLKGITYKEASELIKKFDGINSKKILKWEQYTEAIAKDMEPLKDVFRKWTRQAIGNPIFNKLEKASEGLTAILEEPLKTQPKIMKALEKFLDPEELTALSEGTVDDMIKALSETKFPNSGRDAVMRELLDAGIDKYKSIANKNITSIKKAAGYGDNTISLPENATPAQIMHESLHWVMDKFGTAAKIDPKLGKVVDDLFGTPEWRNITAENMSDVFEAAAKEWTDYLVKGKKPTNPVRRQFFKQVKKAYTEKYGTPVLNKSLTPEDIALIKEAKELAKSGEIFPTPHLMTEANKGGVEALSSDLQEGRTFAGKWSERFYGTQTYEDLAKALKENPDYPIQLLHQNIENSMFKEIVERGTLGGESITPGSIKDAIYLDKNLLDKGSFREAIKNKLTPKDIKDIPNSNNYVAIDKHIANAIEDQLYSSYNAQTGFWGDLFKARKSAMLGSGRYLAGNLTTGVTNALLNSNVHIVGDIIDSIKTQGKLSKSLGTYRLDRNKPVSGTKFLQGLSDINFKTTGKVLRFLDRNMQNAFAEIAANARLREKGISVGNRIQYIENANAREIGRLSSDIQKIALLNSNRSLIPKKIAQLMTPFQPFLQWQDTALQSTGYMIQNHPFLTNVVGLHGMTQLALDKELAQRYGLGVEPDKDIAHYYADPKTGKTMKIESEFSPMQTASKAVYNTAMILAGQKTPEQLVQAGVGEIGYLLAGKNKYGNPLRNLDYTIRQGNRYKYDENGKPVKVEGATPGEIVNGILKMYMALPNVMDKTGGPIATSIMNIGRPEEDRLRYYQAEPGAFVGQILPNKVMPGQTYPYHNIVSGDPKREITSDDMLRSLISGYSTEYYPNSDEVKPQDIARIYRSGIRNNYRIQDIINDVNR